MDSRKNSKIYQDLSILVIDDDDFTRAVTKKMLGRIGIENVFLSKSSEEGLVILNVNNIDLVICDIVMGGMSGLQLSKLIRDKNVRLYGNNREVPIILLTAHTDEKIVATASKVGVNGYMVKPLNISRLDKMILKLCKISEPSQLPA